MPNGSGGYLVLTEPWPSMLRTIWGDDERFKDTYWSKYDKQGWYFAGDGAKKDDDGDLLGARPGRRRHERLRPPALHHRDRVGPGLAPEGRRGGRRRRQGRGHRPGGLRLRDPARGGRRRRRGHRRGAAQPRPQGDRRDRQAAPDHDRPRAAEDPLGQDHAPAAQGRRRAPRGRRRHHPRRQLGDGPDLRGDRQGQGRGAERASKRPRSSRRPTLRCALVGSSITRRGERGWDDRTDGAGKSVARTEPVRAASRTTPQRLFSRGTFPEATRVGEILRAETTGGLLLIAAAVARTGVGQQPVVDVATTTCATWSWGRRRCTST